MLFCYYLILYIIYYIIYSIIVSYYILYYIVLYYIVILCYILYCILYGTSLLGRSGGLLLALVSGSRTVAEPSKRSETE